MADVYATLDVDYDMAGWDYEEDADWINVDDMPFNELADNLHEHCGENEVINKEYSMYVSVEFPNGEWESSYLEHYVNQTVSDYVRQMEKLYKQMTESRDLFKNRAELINKELEAAQRQLEELTNEEKYAIGENPND